VRDAERADTCFYCLQYSCNCPLFTRCYNLLSRRSRQRERLSASVLSICSSVCLFVCLSVCRQNTLQKSLQYRWSINTTALNCLVFEKIAFLHFGGKIQDAAILDFRGPITRFSQKLSNLELCCLMTTYRKSYMGYSKNPLLEP